MRGVRWQDIGLVACTHLESLTLHLRYSWLSHQRGGYSVFFKALDSYTDLLSQHAFLPLRQLILKFSVHFGGCTRILEGDDQNAWGRLDEVLSKLPDLHVTLDIFSLGQLAEGHRHSLERGLRSSLPSPARSGHLRIHFSVSAFPVDSACIKVDVSFATEPVPSCVVWRSLTDNQTIATIIQVNGAVEGYND